MSYPHDILSADEKESIRLHESLIREKQADVIEYLLCLLANARCVASKLAMELEENERYEVIAKYRAGNQWLHDIEEPK